MLYGFEALSVFIGVGASIYLAWLGRVFDPHSTKSVGIGALLLWGITIFYVLFAWLYGAHRGISLYETLTADFGTYGLGERTAGIARLLAITSGLLTIHSLVALLISISEVHADR